MLEARQEFARTMWDLDDLARAKAEYKDFLAVDRATLGDEHESTLAA